MTQRKPVKGVTFSLFEGETITLNSPDGDAIGTLRVYDDSESGDKIYAATFVEPKENNATETS